MQTPRPWKIMTLLGVVVATVGAVTLPRGAAEEPSSPLDAPREAGKDGTTLPSDEKRPWRVLTPEEERVIVHRGTEPPFSGEYTDHFETGVYACKRCGAMLYRSEDKFHSNCGWPAFDDEFPGAVERRPDPDGVRTEIVCANCEGHLGHVFLGEGFTEKNTRHCVNSISMVFVPADQVQYGRAIFAGGCFWGVEYWLKRAPGVLETTVGYTGGTLENPTYRDLHSRPTGHAEAVEVIYDPVRTTFRDLAKLFFEIHDPTQLDRQGPDIGPEYRSEIFALDDEQRRVAEELISQLRDRGLAVVTKVTPAATFWPAEDYHQDYLDARGARPSCHIRRPIEWDAEKPGAVEGTA